MLAIAYRGREGDRGRRKNATGNGPSPFSRICISGIPRARERGAEVYGVWWWVIVLRAAYRGIRFFDEIVYSRLVERVIDYLSKKRGSGDVKKSSLVKEEV